ncbi:MAG: glycoside hydrolase family 3 C-terminal domain-containing protein [Anaerolineae bacterium]|nr:glycoside hydrolase family 3 C-terminal domain-containing protein [Anaerolineae bacterium]
MKITQSVDARAGEMEQRIEELLRKLTLKEKVGLMSGADNWHTLPIERLGIPWLTMTDGPHGVRTVNERGRTFVPATAFPTGVAMAATWNPALIERVGVALAEETHALGCDVLLGPCVNIVRHPLAGRNFEAYAEDPYLAGRVGVAWVKGVQSQGVGASLKHYACNNQEVERMRGNSIVDERTLREIYLPQFEAVVNEAHPWTVMCAYNRINGDYASQHQHLLNEILKGEWHYDGAVVSDWGANHTIVESAKGGLDIEMPGPAKYYDRLLVEAVHNWQIEEAVITEAARRMLRLLARVGKLDSPATPAGALNTPEHQALAREVAEEAITLLKDDLGVLPLRPERMKSVAIIGPNAAEAVIAGGGSSQVEPPYRVSPLDGLRARLGDRVAIHYAKGCTNVRDLSMIQASTLRPARGEGVGLLGEYFGTPDFSGTPVIERVDVRFRFWRLSFAPLEQTPPTFSVRWSGQLTVPSTGAYSLGLVNSGDARIYLDGKLVVANHNPQSTDAWPVTKAQAAVKLVGGQVYDIRIEFVRPAWLDLPHIQILFGATPTAEEAAAGIAEAVEVAREADVALIFAGYSNFYEAEGLDRPDMELGGVQNELIRAVAAANPNTVVVLNVGAPVAMPWVDEVAALLLAYYPGMENGNAVARVLLGEVNPSGKLSVTYPKRLEDTPAFVNYPGGKDVRYGEGIFVGYRYYDIKGSEPLFPFGHGLSYTSFEYSDLRVTDTFRPGEPVSVSVTVKNTGDRAGKEVVQLYVRDLVSSLLRPIKELKRFAKIELQPGESQTVRFELDSRALSFYDPERKAWVAEPGDFEVLIGSSSRDIRAVAALKLVE